MEKKTKVEASEGRQEMLITREFELPVDLLFRAYTEPELIAQWMGTKVLEYESRDHGSWRFETSDEQGNILFSAHGVIHELVPDKKITRTFEMANSGVEAQIEYLEFEKISDESSRLRIQMVYRSAEQRDMVLRMPFAYGINMAHNQLQKLMQSLNKSR